MQKYSFDWKTYIGAIQIIRDTSIDGFEMRIEIERKCLLKTNFAAFKQNFLLPKAITV